jgi:hypothetical protein
MGERNPIFPNRISQFQTTLVLPSQTWRPAKITLRPQTHSRHQSAPHEATDDHPLH